MSSQGHSCPTMGPHIVFATHHVGSSATLPSGFMQPSITPCTHGGCGARTPRLPTSHVVVFHVMQYMLCTHAFPSPPPPTLVSPTNTLGHQQHPTSTINRDLTSPLTSRACTTCKHHPSYWVPTMLSLQLIMHNGPHALGMGGTTQVLQGLAPLAST
jgi:hypothetical protein